MPVFAAAAGRAGDDGKLSIKDADGASPEFTRTRLVVFDGQLCAQPGRLIRDSELIRNDIMLLGRAKRRGWFRPYSPAPPFAGGCRQ
jgi:hypothetical protein